MKKWILLLSIFLSVFTAAAYSEQALHEDALDTEAVYDESSYNQEYADQDYYLDQEGPLPLPPDDPIPPGETPPPGENPPPPTPPPGGPESFTLGGGVATRWGTRTYTFYPYNPKLIKLRLIASRSNIEAKHVWITYSDTMKAVEISQLRGELSRSRSKEVRLNGRSIFKVDVEVSANSFWRQPGAFQMDGTSLR